MSKQLLLTIIAQLFTIVLFAQTGINNLNFETWGTNPVLGDQPNGWVVLNGAGNQKNTTNPYNGTYSLKLQTSVLAFTGDIGHFAYNGTPLSVGEAYTQKPASLDGYVRYNLLGNDTGLIFIQLTKNQAFVGGGMALFGGSESNWTFISVPVEYILPDNPDTAIILFSSSGVGLLQDSLGNPVDFGTLTMGSVLEVDYFSLNMDTEINDLTNNTSIKVYPNPVDDVLLVYNSNKENLTLIIFDNTGKQIKKETLQSTRNSIDVNNLPNGLYLYQILNESEDIYKFGKFNVVR